MVFLILIRLKSPTSCSLRVTVLRLTLARFSSIRSHAISEAVFLTSAVDLRLMIPSNFLDVFRGLPLRGRSFKPYPERYLTIISFTVDLPIDNSEAISREDFPSSENLITLTNLDLRIPSHVYASTTSYELSVNIQRDTIHKQLVEVLLRQIYYVAGNFCTCKYNNYNNKYFHEHK